MSIIKKSSILSTAILCGSIMSTPASAADWLARARIINVSPNDSSSQVPAVAGSGVTVNNDTVAELDFTYMVNKNVGLELILATTGHHATGTGALAGADVGTVKLLPPTLTAQYHFQPGAKIRPYIGAGLNYTLFYKARLGAALVANGATGIDYDNSFGLAAQAGVDIDINKDWFVNLDVKYIKIDTTATITGGALAGNVNLDINPWVFGVGIGTRF